MGDKKDFSFTGIVRSVKFNLVNTAVFIPNEMAVDLPKGRIRVNGFMNGAPFSLSIFYRKETGRFFPMSSTLRRAANVGAGDLVDVSFSVIQPDRVEIPTPRETVLTEVDKTGKIWKKIAITLQKVLPSYIETVKMIDIRMRRALETVQRARSAAMKQKPTTRKKNPSKK